MVLAVVLNEYFSIKKTHIFWILSLSWKEKSERANKLPTCLIKMIISKYFKIRSGTVKINRLIKSKNHKEYLYFCDNRAKKHLTIENDQLVIKRDCYPENFVYSFETSKSRMRFSKKYIRNWIEFLSFCKEDSFSDVITNEYIPYIEYQKSFNSFYKKEKATAFFKFINNRVELFNAERRFRKLKKKDEEYSLILAN